MNCDTHSWKHLVRRCPTCFPALPLGTKVGTLGTIAGIRTEGGELGERYYFLVAKSGTISFMPAAVVEGYE